MSIQRSSPSFVSRRTRSPRRDAALDRPVDPGLRRHPVLGRRHRQRHRPPDDLVGRPAEDPLAGGVPDRDVAVEVERLRRDRRRANDRREDLGRPVELCLGPVARGDLALGQGERAEELAVGPPLEGEPEDDDRGEAGDRDDDAASRRRASRAGPTTTAAATPAIAARPAATSAPIIWRPRSWGWTSATPTIGRTTANARPDGREAAGEDRLDVQPVRRRAEERGPRPADQDEDADDRRHDDGGQDLADRRGRISEGGAEADEQRRDGGEYRIDRMAGPSAVVDGAGRGRSAPSPGRSTDWGIGTELPHAGDWVAGQQTGLDCARTVRHFDTIRLVSLRRIHLCRLRDSHHVRRPTGERPEPRPAPRHRRRQPRPAGLRRAPDRARRRGRRR